MPMPMRTNRRQLLAASALGLCAPASWAQTQNWPHKPITLVVSYNAGGNADLRARMLGPVVARLLGVPVLVENKPGANGNIGHEAVAKAAPDGHTLVLATMGPMAISAFVYPRLGFDPELAFAPIVMIEKAPMVLVTRSDKPFQTVKDLVDFGQHNPGRLAFGNAGSGSAHHLSAELFMQSAGLRALAVPYKGGSQAATALLTGEIDALFEQSYAALPSIASGKLRALAVTSDKRMASLPQVPTMAEAGHPQVRVYNWLGLAAPRGTPAAIVQRLNEVFNQALALPEIHDKIAAPGNLVGSGSPDEFKAWMQSERRKWGPVVQALNLKID